MFFSNCFGLTLDVDFHHFCPEVSIIIIDLVGQVWKLVLEIRYFGLIIILGPGFGEVQGTSPTKTLQGVTLSEYLLVIIVIIMYM